MTTKFSIKEKVFIIHDNKINSCSIKVIRTDYTGTVYSLEIENNKEITSRKEGSIFKTKEDLIKTL